MGFFFNIETSDTGSRTWQNGGGEAGCHVAKATVPKYYATYCQSRPPEGRHVFGKGIKFTNFFFKRDF